MKYRVRIMSEELANEVLPLVQKFFPGKAWHLIYRMDYINNTQHAVSVGSLHEVAEEEIGWVDGYLHARELFKK